MNRAIELATVLCLLLAASAFVALVVRRSRSMARPGSVAGARLPVAMRLASPVAALLEPLVECIVSRARLGRMAHELEVLGLAPRLTALRWESLRVAQAILLAGAAALLLAAPLATLLLAGAGYLYAGMWLKQQRERQHHAIVRELPAWLDLMTVCVEAGATLTAGLRVIIAQAPPSALREYFERVLREIRGGRARAQAFAHVAGLYGNESLGTLASALAHAESSGMSLGQVLRAQAAQRTAERFARAEKLAMQAPVKMLGPLILCIFPCTFIVIGVPIAVRLREAFAA